MINGHSTYSLNFGAKIGTLLKFNENFTFRFFFFSNSFFIIRILFFFFLIIIIFHISYTNRYPSYIFLFIFIFIYFKYCKYFILSFHSVNYRDCERISDFFSISIIPLRNSPQSNNDRDL